MVKKRDTQVINVRLPREILNWIDSLVKKEIYANKSEAIREFIRLYLDDIHRMNNKIGE